MLPNLALQDQERRLQRRVRVLALAAWPHPSRHARPPLRCAGRPGGAERRAEGLGAGEELVTHEAVHPGSLRAPRGHRGMGQGARLPRRLRRLATGIEWAASRARATG